MTERTYYIVMQLATADQAVSVMASVIYSTHLLINTQAGIEEVRSMVLEQARIKWPERVFTMVFILNSMEIQ